MCQARNHGSCKPLFRKHGTNNKYFVYSGNFHISKEGCTICNNLHRDHKNIMPFSEKQSSEKQLNAF